LENNDCNTIKKDLNKLPIEGITGENSKDEILDILSKYGIRHCERSEAISPSIKPVVVEVWGSGQPMREFLWSEDMADACVYIMENVDFKNIVKTQRHSERSENVAEESHNVTSSQHDWQAGAVERSHNVTLSAVEGSSPTANHQPPTTNRQPPITNTHINIGTGKEISIKELAETIKTIVGFKGDFYFNTNKPDGTLRKLTDATKLEKLGWRYKVELKDGINRMYHWYLNK